MSRRGSGYGDNRRKARSTASVTDTSPAVTPQTEVIAGVDLVLAGTPQVIVN